MSSVTEVNNTGNQAHFDYDVSKVFIWNNRYQEETLNNASGGVKDFVPGTLLGRVTASGKLVPVASAAVDGSQIPVGILKTNVVQLADTADIVVDICVAGDVAEEMLVLDGSDTLTTDIGGRTIRDRIGADTVGIILKLGDELTGFDNQ